MKQMKDYAYHYALKGKMKGSFEQQHEANKMIGCANFVHNRLVALNNELHMLRKVGVYLAPVARRIEYIESVLDSAKTLKNSAPVLSEVNDDIVQNEIANYRQAWKNFFAGRANIPTFHSKRNGGSCQVNTRYDSGKSGILESRGVRFIDKKHMILPGIGRVKVLFSPKLIDALFSRTAETRMGTVTIERDAAGEYWVSVLFGSDEPFVKPYEKTDKAIGIDLNLSNFLTDSNGEAVDNPSPLKKAEEKLAREQRKLSRRRVAAEKKNISLSEAMNYQEQRVVVAKLHRNIARQREDFHNRVAKRYVENQDVVILEDLRVKNLLGNHNLAKAISDVGWRSFITICEQKASMRGHLVITVSPNYTTQTCSECGTVSDKKILLGVEAWTCSHCGAVHGRDHNSAKNVLDKGIKHIAEDPMRYATTVKAPLLADLHSLCDSILSESAVSGKRV